MVGLVRSLGRQTQVVGLDSGQVGELDVCFHIGISFQRRLHVSGVAYSIDPSGTWRLPRPKPWARCCQEKPKSVQGKSSGFLKANVLHSDGISLGVGPESDLGQGLVGERTRHDERGVSSGTTQVDQSSFSQKDEMPARRHSVSVDLSLDVGDALGVLLQPRNVDLDVKVTDVANDGVLLHDAKVVTSNDVSASSGGNEDVLLGGSLFHGGDLVTGHSGLQRVDGIDFGNNNPGSVRSERFGTTFADISESCNNGDLSGQHNVGGPLDSVDQGFSAPVVVVELALGDRIVDVDGRDLQSSLPEGLVQVVYTGGGLLRDSLDVLEHLGVLLMNESSKIVTVVQQQVGGLAVRELGMRNCEISLGSIELSIDIKPAYGSQLLFNTPNVFLLGLALPGKDGDTSRSDSGGSVVLSGEDVARRPGNLSTQVGQGLDQDSAA